MLRNLLKNTALLKRVALAAALLIMSGVLYLLVSNVVVLQAADRGFRTLAPKFALLLAAGAVSYLLPCYLLHLKEAKLVVKRFKNQFFRPVNLG